MSALPARVRPFADPAFYPHRPDSVELIQTHISWVFLAGEYVYKVKKPVNLGFLDFRTLARRRHFCREEVRLNQRLAPNAYLDVVSVTRAGGAYRLGGEGRTHEVAVWMRRLPADRMLDRLVAAGEADHRLMEDIGRTIADFHARAATGPSIAHFGRVEAIRRNLAENLARTGRFPAEVLPLELRRAVTGFLRQTLRDQRRRFAERVRAGRIRDCHGDLQAQHVCCTDPIQVFDCIEFNHRFRYGDTAGEIAFLAMDLDVARPARTSPSTSSTPISTSAATTPRCRCSTSIAPTGPGSAARSTACRRWTRRAPIARPSWRARAATSTSPPPTRVRAARPR